MEARTAPSGTDCQQAPRLVGDAIDDEGVAELDTQPVEQHRVDDRAIDAVLRRQQLGRLFALGSCGL